MTRTSPSAWPRLSTSPFQCSRTPSPNLAPTLQSAPTLTLVPESLEGTPTPPAGARRYRDDTANEGAGPLPAWWGDSSDPLVYVTFGSVAGGLGLFPGFYRDVIAALADVPIRVLLTIGDAGDPNDLGILPDNVHAERGGPRRR